MARSHFSVSSNSSFTHCNATGISVEGILGADVNVDLTKFGHAYSSTNLDLANSKMDQDVLAQEWMNATNPDNNVIYWIDEGLSGKQVNELMPEEQFAIFSPKVLALLQVSIMISVPSGLQWW